MLRVCLDQNKWIDLGGREARPVERVEDRLLNPRHLQRLPETLARTRVRGRQNTSWSSPLYNDRLKCRSSSPPRRSAIGNAGGQNLQVMIGLQDLSQARERWGEAAAASFYSEPGGAAQRLSKPSTLLSVSKWPS